MFDLKTTILKDLITIARFSSVFQVYRNNASSQMAKRYTHIFNVGWYISSEGHRNARRESGTLLEGLGLKVWSWGWWTWLAWMLCIDLRTNHRLMLCQKCHMEIWTRKCGCVASKGIRGAEERALDDNALIFRLPGTAEVWRLHRTQSLGTWGRHIVSVIVLNPV